MTREQKLALIVGFSLVLLVGVLISDHLSRARQAKIASVGPIETPQAPIGAPANDPLNALNIALNAPAPSGQSLPGPSSLASQPPPVAPSEPNSGVPSPTTIAQGQTRSSPGGDGTSLEEAVRRAGGTTRLGANGIVDIILPETARVITTSDSGATSTPTALGVSPLYGYPAPVKNLGTNEQFKTHTVQKGETLFQIAGKYYGTGHVWRDLAKYNNVSTKDGSVRVGSRLKIPSKDLLLGKAMPSTQTAGRDASSQQIAPAAKTTPNHRQDVPVLKPEIKLATYTVKKGETLGEISKKVLGSSKRWEELAEFNKLEDEDSIAAGTVLKVPPMRG